MDTTALLSRAATSFDIGDIREITPATKGLANENYFIRTARGEYVLRILKTQTIEGLRNEVSIEEQLKKAGILAAQLMQTTEENYYIDIDGKKITCSKRIVGIHPEVSSEFARKLGILLAKFPEAVTSIPEATISVLLKRVACKEVERLPENPLGILIKRQLNESLDIFEADLPTGFIHSDLHTGNLLVTPEEEIAIFDFEDTDRNILILDLAASATSLYWGELTMDESALKGLLEGYETVRKLTPAEKKYFNKAVLYRSAAIAAWLYNNSYESYVQDSIDSGDRVVRLYSVVMAS